MREPRDDKTDGGVRPAGDAEHGEVPCVRVRRHNQHDQIADRTEETRAGDDETAGLETVGEVSRATEYDGGDYVWWDGEDLSESIG